MDILHVIAQKRKKIKIIIEDQKRKEIFNAITVVNMDIWLEIALNLKLKNHRESSKIAINAESLAILQEIVLNKNEELGE